MNRLLPLILLALLMPACQAAEQVEPAITYVVITTTPTTVPSRTVTPTHTSTVSPSPTTMPSSTPTALTTPTNTATPLPTTTPTYTPYCAQPPENYERVTVRGHDLNARTLAMLQTAQEIYDGPADLLRLTQGSYRDTLDISFGTHAGGGAVDISLRHPQTDVFLLEEAEAIVQALRAAGFAAWYRRAGDLGPSSGHHLHAIAIDDRELSEAARKQVESYFSGMDGLIDPWGPNPDRHGGPLICPWMEELRDEWVAP